MKNVNIEFHCHSCYSHDSNTSIESIARACENIGVNYIIICDHDNYGKTAADIEVLKNHGVTLIPAIEFTTDEGIHIVGIHPEVYSLQAKPRFYKAIDIVDALKKKSAYISIPHPYHGTGLIGNGKLSEEDIDYCLSKADFLEIANYKYGEVKDLSRFSKYSHLRKVIGSDAHASVEVGSHYNCFSVPDDCNDVLGYIIDNDVDFKHVYYRKHGKLFWAFRDFKKSWIYQGLLKMFPKDLRKEIKNKLINK